jgi:Flp pilus assembly protein TadG
MRRLRHFVREQSGASAMLFALSSVPVVASVGVAIDYSHAAALRSAMQSAADATALALVRPDKPVSSVSAQNYFQSAFAHSEITNLNVSATTSETSGGRAITVTAAGSFKTSLMGLMGYTSIDLRTQAKAFYAQDGVGCVLALSSSADNAMLFNGSTSVNLNSCSAYSNSSSSTAISAGGSSTLTALSIGVVGGANVSPDNVSLTEGIRTGQVTVADPYQDVNVDPVGNCTQTNFNAKTAMTIDPGVYCNGISINAGAKLTLNPGVYYIDRGSLMVNGGATLVGDGVTLIFTSSTGKNWATATISGNATVNLTPPNTGATVGIVVFGDRNISLGTTFKFNGGATQQLSGAVYIPTGAISYSGGMGTSTSCTQIIGDTVTFTGNSDVAVNCSSYKTKPFGPDVVRLTS